MGFQADDMPGRLRAEFPAALRDGQIVAYFQPEVQLSTGHVLAAEALARWEHPELGVLAPALFTPLADQLGLMPEFTRLMLRLSLAQHREWATAGWSIPIAVNIGPDSVADPGFPAIVSELLAAEQVPGRMLTLEVSEETGTGAVSSGFFAELAEQDVRVSLDDFGTGYASLESLGGWPINELKLDRSLVKPIFSNASFRAIVATTIDLAHQLGLVVVAEGVESEAVRSELQALGCDVAQGYFLGRPMAAAAFAEWLRDIEQRRGPVGYRQAGDTAAERRARATAAVRRRVPRAVQRVTAPAGGAVVGSALVLLLAYGLWQVFRWGGPARQTLIGDLSFVPLNGAAIYYAWLASRRRELGRAVCRTWRLLTVALVFYLLGDLLQLYYENIRHQRPYPTWADAAYLSFYACAFAGLITLPSRRRTGTERVRLLLDMGTVFAGGTVLLWYTALGQATAGLHTDLADIVTLAYPVGDLILLFGTLSVLWLGAPRSSVLPLRIFACGLLLLIAADMGYDYLVVHSAYTGGDPIDTLWVLGLLVMVVAAASQLRTVAVDGFAAPPRARPVGRPSSVPYVIVGLSYLLLAVVGLSAHHSRVLGGVLVGAVVLAVLASARHYTAVRDFRRLASGYRELAAIDGMTGLYNRRHFMEAAEAAHAHARRLGQPLVAMLIDVDRFKEINDVHGHAVGDRVLAELAQSCREYVRPGDVVGRYGGDEFTIIVPGITSLRAIQLATRLTRPAPRVLGADGMPVAFTVSVGIAECHPCHDLAALLARADEAMYQAKRAGGGSWRIFDDPELPAPDLPELTPAS